MNGKRLEQPERKGYESHKDGDGSEERDQERKHKEKQMYVRNMRKKVHEGESIAGEAKTERSTLEKISWKKEEKKSRLLAQLSRSYDDDEKDEYIQEEETTRVKQNLGARPKLQKLPIPKEGMKPIAVKQISTPVKKVGISHTRKLVAIKIPIPPHEELKKEVSKKSSEIKQRAADRISDEKKAKAASMGKQEVKRLQKPLEDDSGKATPERHIWKFGMASTEIKAERDQLFTSSKEFMINEAIRPCYICKQDARYYKGSFLCLVCRKKFERIVELCETVKCSSGSRCVSPQNCDYCLAETFYSSGIRANDIAGFRHLSPGYKPFTRASERPTLSEEEVAFCKFYNKCLRVVLDWVWKQGDLLLLTPSDRATLLQSNAARARIMWIAAEAMYRHNVIKTDSLYLPINKFSSELIRKTVVDINNLAGYFRSLLFTPQHVYILKMLSIFQTGKRTECINASTSHDYCDIDDGCFERVDDIKTIAENYRNVLREMKINDSDLERITDAIDTMYCIDAIVTTEELVEAMPRPFFEWVESNMEWELKKTEPTPTALSEYPPERIELCYNLNKMIVPTLKSAIDNLSYHSSFRDQKAFLCDNFMTTLIAYMCWNLDEEALEDYSDNRNADTFVKSFYSSFRTCYEASHLDIVARLRFAEYIMICLTTHFSETDSRIRDTDVKQLKKFIRQSTLQVLERKLKMEYIDSVERQEEAKRLEMCIEPITELFEKTAGKLELSHNILPLLLNTKSWIMEPY